jgi:hypothetical protein
MTKKYIAFLFLVLFHITCVNGQTLVWQGEGEMGELLGAGEIKSGCANASGGEFTTLSNVAGNGLRFNNVNIPVQGNYQLVVNYFNVTSQKMEVFVNDDSSGLIDFPAATWCYQGSAGQTIVELTLPSGLISITLKVYNNTATPYIDKLLLKSNSTISFNPVNYYLSSNDGNDGNSGLSMDKAWKSLSKISSQILHSGDSVFFKSGETFPGQLNITGSGTENKVIYFGRYGSGNKPVLNGAITENGAYLSTIFINNQEYIEIAGLEITNNRLIPRLNVSDDLAYGIYVFNNGITTMHHYRFHDLNIHDVYSIATNASFNDIRVAGIAFQSSRNTKIGEEKNIHDVIVEDCYIARTTRFGITTGHGGGDTGVGNDSINRNMNVIFRNNHFYQTGGSCILPSGTYNGLVENNIFEHPGSDVDPRMAKRGSAVWYFNCRNVISQYNKAYHVRGEGDSYGQHIDYGNKNIILQYNYSEDSEGGFCEILGNNVNSVYRFNVSVNDGFRVNAGNTLWVSDYAGSVKIKSDSSFIYNNSIYTDANITPDISIVGMNTFVYNNIFCATGISQIGEKVSITIAPGSQFYMSNNLFYGNVSSNFSNLDIHPVFGNPVYTKPGDLNIEAYRLGKDSKALNAGKIFPEPKFPMAGKGIFKNIKLYPDLDLYGNPVNVSTTIPNIGAYNGEALNPTGIANFEILDASNMMVYPNPVKQNVYVTINALQQGKVKIHLSDLQGRVLNSSERKISQGPNNLDLVIDSNIGNGIYVVSIEEEGYFISKRIVLAR